MWAVLVALLALLGLGVEDRLHRGDLVVEGTDSERAMELAERHFGDSESLVVLLEGPRAGVDAQGPRLAEQLDRHEDVAVLGPWTPGAAGDLRPEPDRALIIVRANRSFGEVSEEIVPKVRSDVDRLVEEPVSGHVTGYPDVAAGMHNGSIEALRRAELIAAPLLLIVLLAVFRSVVAAAIPLVLGLATIAAGRGLLDIFNRITDLDVVALNMGSMMGLALGVDYSLVIVSRFREELRAGSGSGDAARIARGTAGRTVLFAGLALIAAMLAANLVTPGNLLVSAGVGVISSAVLSVVGAVTAVPAALALIGERIDALSIGRSRGTEGGWGGLALRTISRPTVAAAVVLALILLLSLPALGLNMGSPDPRALPASSPERQDFEKLVDTLGAGWSAPYEIIVAADEGRITDRKRLRKLGRWQRRVSRDPDVQAVMGPGTIARRARRLDDMERGLERAGKQVRRAKRDSERLANGLRRVDAGVGELRSGLSEAARGAARLESGAGEGATGAARLRAGLRRARSGARRLLAGITRARSGTTRLVDGSGGLARGSLALRRGLAQARRESESGLPRVRRLREGLERGSRDLEELREPAQIADDELDKALAALERMAPTSKADPSYRDAYEAVFKAEAAVSGRYPHAESPLAIIPLPGFSDQEDPRAGQPVREGYDGLDASLAEASRGVARAAEGVKRIEQRTQELIAGLERMERGARRLGKGLDRLESGARRLLSGMRRLEGGGGELASGLGRLERGGGRLASGADRLRAGAGELENGLDSGARRTGRLSSGVKRMRTGVAEARSRTEKLGASTSGANTRIFKSGYLMLAALDSAKPEQRKASTFAVNLDEGGTATRIAVIHAADPSQPGDPLRGRLERAAAELGRDTGTETEVGGPAVRLQDFDSEASSRLWLLVLALVTVTYVVLVPVLRSLLLPLLAVLLNVLTVAAAFGVLVLLFQGDAPPLGGSGELDAIMVLAIFAIVFGLSIDYEVFLLARMREGYDRLGTTDEAIEYGVRRTAAVITGAALIMTGVFAAFALADIASMRQLGIGLTVAVLLDATVVRLVLLPALIKLCGSAAWWLPRPLERILPPIAGDAGAGGKAGLAIDPGRAAVAMARPLGDGGRFEREAPATQALSTEPLALAGIRPGGNGDRASSRVRDPVG